MNRFIEKILEKADEMGDLALEASKEKNDC